MTGAEISVAVVDDQQLLRAGVRMMLDSQADLVFAGEASSGEEAITLARTARPNVMLLDIRMPGRDGVEVIAPILEASPQTRVVMLTTFGIEDYIFASLRAGASGFLLKDATPEQLLAGIRAVASGEMLLAPDVTRRIIENFMTGAPRLEDGPLAALTERERDVLSEVAAGRSNAEIGAALFISEGTVKTHVSRVLAKLQLRDRVQAVIAAYEYGLVEPRRRPG
ncbi:MAG: response regulator transcription factor [Demequina sp.]|nr:response regulator transcription factor [Demequina sp.]